jgi:hypothetical protein
MDPTRRQKNHDRIASTKLKIASGSVRDAVAVDEDCGGSGGGFVSSAIALFYRTAKQRQAVVRMRIAGRA